MNRSFVIIWAIAVHAARGIRVLPPNVIVLAIGIHIVWGVLLIINPVVASAAAILGGFHWIVSLGIEGALLGETLLVAATLALVSLLMGARLSNVNSLALLMPQFSLLVAAFLSDSESVLTGMLPDGRTVDHLLLFAALCPVMFISVLHSFAIIERHTAWTKHSSAV